MANAKKGNKKILIAGTVGIAAFGIAYWYFNHTTAQQQIAAQPTVVPVPGTSAVATPPGTVTVLPVTSVPITAVVGPTVSAPVVVPTPAPAPSQTSQPTQAQMIQALSTHWAANIQNPSMGNQMLSVLTLAQVTGLYNILTTQWETGAPATPSNTAFWNALRAQYPFLNTGGVGCSSITSCP